MTVAQCAQQMLEIEAEKNEGGMYSPPPPYTTPLMRLAYNSILPHHTRDWCFASRFPRPAVCRGDTAAAFGSRPRSTAALVGVVGKEGA